MKQLINPWTALEAYQCYGCCPTNPLGCQMTFYEDGDDIVSVWKATPQHQSWVNYLHGGVQATLLDEVCGWVVFRKLDTAGVTAKMEMRYRKPVSTLKPYVLLRAHLESFNHRIAVVKGEIRDADNQLCIECTCTYFTYQHDKAVSEMQFISTDVTGEELSLEQVIQRTLQTKRNYRGIRQMLTSIG